MHHYHPSWMRRVLPLAIVCSTIAAFPALAQKPDTRSRPDYDAPLMKGARCTASNQIGASLVKQEQDVSVRKLAFLSQMQLVASSEETVRLTCKADKEKYAEAKLQLGVSDNADSNTSMTINIYQGSKLLNTYAGTPGTLINYPFLLDDRSVPKNPDNISIEMICHKPSEGSNCNLHILEAKLLHDPEKYPTGMQEKPAFSSPNRTDRPARPAPQPSIEIEPSVEHEPKSTPSKPPDNTLKTLGELLLRAFGK